MINSSDVVIFNMQYCDDAPSYSYPPADALDSSINLRSHFPSNLTHQTFGSTDRPLCSSLDVLCASAMCLHQNHLVSYISCYLVRSLPYKYCRTVRGPLNFHIIPWSPTILGQRLISLCHSKTPSMCSRHGLLVEE